MIYALGVTAQGDKQVLGLRQGGTEAQVVTALLDDVRDRGIGTIVRYFFVLDGSKAVHADVRRVWGQYAANQCCQIHKKRNVKAQLPDKHLDELARMVNLVYHGNDYEAALNPLVEPPRFSTTGWTTSECTVSEAGTFQATKVSTFN